MYLRDHNVSKDWSESRDITLAVKVEVVDNVQYLVAAIAVVSPLEAFVTEEMDTENGLDSFPKPVNPPKGKYPFIKAEGRATAIVRLEDAIKTLKDKKTSFRGKGMVAVANNHSRIMGGLDYAELESLIYIKNNEVFPLLNMSRSLINEMAISMFRKKEDARLSKASFIDLGFSFNSKEI
jgi:hypothetical protein